MSGNNNNNYGNSLPGLYGAFNTARGDPSSSGPPPSSSGADKLSPITEKLMKLTTTSKLRGERLKRVKQLFDYMALLTNEIFDASSKSSQSLSEQQITSINESLNKLEQQLNTTDNSSEELVKALIEHANSLIRIREGMPKYDKDNSSVKQIAPILNELNMKKGGYKHSKTNSRKYVVKRFRSARNSYRRGKKRGGKRNGRTLRRNRKI